MASRVCSLARRFAMLVLAILLTAYAGKSLYSIWVNLQIDNIWFNDFFAIWSFAKFPLTNHAVDIYDRSVLQEFQESLGTAPSVHLPFPYPPSFMLLLIPFGLLGYYGAYGAWILGTFVFYLVVSWHREWPWSAIFVIILAPATILTFVYGQSGFLTSALMIGGFRFATSRPILSGVLFGLVSIKPQIGILIPISLISARRWQTLAAAGVTVLVLVLASSAAFGWSVWPLWAAQLLAHADWAATTKPQYMPTIIATLTFLGVDLPVARRTQAAVAVAVAVIIWVCFRRGVTNLGSAALLVGTFLATPYAFVYDMPMVTNAILAMIYHEGRMRCLLRLPEALVLVWSLILPALIVETWRPGAIRCVPLILLFGLIVWRMFPGRYGGPETGAVPRRDRASVR
jgi:Glycosyltransferase family 87